MITAIILEILGNWVLMGVILGAALTAGLYFAILCEKIVDSLFRR